MSQKESSLAMAVSSVPQEGDNKIYFRDGSWIIYERKNFIRWIISHPLKIFLLCPDFFRILFLKSQSLLFKRFASPHAFRKKPVPKGLIYCDPVAKREEPKKDFVEASIKANDQEELFASARWSEFITYNNLSFLSLDKVFQALDLALPKSDPRWETYSASQRVAQVCLWLKHNEAFEPSQKQRQLLESFLEEHVSWILSRLEYYGRRSTNNHLINNARAVFLAGCLLKKSDWTKSGLNIFHFFMPELSDSFGFVREGSSHYQLLITTWLMDMLWFASSSKDIVSIDDLNAIEKIAKNHYASSLYFLDADMQLCSFFGDISPDQSPLETAAKLKFYKDIFYLKNQLLFDDIMHKSNWMSGCFLGQRLLLKVISREYPEKFVTHRHEDVTSFEWFIEDHPVLIDSGRSSYQDHALTYSQIGPTGHNVMLVDGLAPFGSSLFSHADFRPKAYSQAKSQHHCLIEGDALVFQIQSDGFFRLEDGCFYKRSIKLSKEALIVEDALISSKDHHYQWNWHIDPSWSVRFLGDLSWVLFKEGRQILCEQKLLTQNKEQAPVTTYLEQKTISRFYGDKQAAPCLVYQSQSQSSFQMTTTFRMVSCAE